MRFSSLPDKAKLSSCCFDSNFQTALSGRWKSSASGPIRQTRPELERSVRFRTEDMRNGWCAVFDDATSEMFGGTTWKRHKHVWTWTVLPVKRSSAVVGAPWTADFGAQFVEKSSEFSVVPETLICDIAVAAACLLDCMMHWTRSPKAVEIAFDRSWLAGFLIRDFSTLILHELWGKQLDQWSFAGCISYTRKLEVRNGTCVAVYYRWLVAVLNSLFRIAKWWADEDWRVCLTVSHVSNQLQLNGSYWSAYFFKAEIVKLVCILLCYYKTWSCECFLGIKESALQKFSQALIFSELGAAFRLFEMCC